MGNGFAVRLRSAIARTFGLRDAGQTEIGTAGSKATAARDAGRAKQLERLRTLRGRAPADFKFDRDEANER
jgi:antitoxin MazE